MTNCLEAMQQENSTEQAILQAAEAEFMAKGFSGARTVSIAAAAGVSHTMLHYHFKTKETLYQKILESKLELLTSKMYEILHERPDLPMVERAVHLTSRHFDFLMENPQLPSFFFTEVKFNPDKIKFMQLRMHEFYRQISQEFQDAMDREITQGTLAPIDFSDLVANILFLNATSIIMSDVFGAIVNMTKEEVLAKRRTENCEIIRQRLTPHHQNL